MCPVCIAAAALIAGKATSTGGVAALVVKKFRPSKVTNGDSAKESLKQTNREGESS